MLPNSCLFPLCIQRNKLIISSIVVNIALKETVGAVNMNIGGC